MPTFVSGPLSARITPAEAEAAPPEALPYRLIAVLLLILLLVWQWPAGGGVWHGSLFPVSLHTATEFGAIVASFLLFSVAWHARSAGQPGHIVLIGCGFLAVGLIDFGHAMSYKGMPVFVTPSDPEKSIHFWLAARYVAACTLLLAAWRPVAPLASAGQRWGWLAGALTLTALVYGLNIGLPEVWPRTFIEGQGLTPFKVAAEYGVIAVVCLAAWGFHRQIRHDLVAYIATDLCEAALITVLSELCLTLYANVNDVFSLLGHLYKIVAYFFIYRAVFVTSVRDPYLRLSVEVQERRDAERRVEFLAFHDVLTGLPNRALARDRLAQALADGRRHGTLVALAFLDLDNFKTINDSLGHACGDRVLQAVGQVLRQQVRGGDTVCRQGGDEFLLILRDLPDTEAAGLTMTKLLQALCEPVVVDGLALSISASVGLAMAPLDGHDFETLLQKADTAMYRAKEEGRNAYRFFDEQMNRASLERLTLRQGLRQALDHQQFVLHYQPQVALGTGRVLGVEALIRWQHPQWGLVPPGRFISVAEESGLIVPMGDWVIAEACRQAAQWDAEGLPPLTMAVNLSALQFKRGEVERVVSEALAQSGLPAHRLELELTESVLISDPDAVCTRLSSLKSLGVTLAIDDFGTGYSSLSYLKRFAVDKLKIDRSFVQDLERQPDEDAIVRAIVHMATSLGLKTIAEGVETWPMAQKLRAVGCDEAQGYLYARPMGAHEMAQWLRRQMAEGPALGGEALSRSGAGQAFLA